MSARKTFKVPLWEKCPHCGQAHEWVEATPAGRDAQGRRTYRIVCPATEKETVLTREKST